jgi:uncharacterized membrane protein YfcA
MSLLEAALGVLSGFVAGTLAGAFGVGGAVVTTPAVQVLLGAPPIVAVGTPLPVIFPTTAVAAWSYARTGNLDGRTVRWSAPPGAAGSAAGALATDIVEPHALLLATAALVCWQAVSVARGRDRPEEARRRPSGWAYAAAGLGAGIVSGLLGIGGGIVLVPALTSLLGMPLKRAIGTSLVVITAIVVPGTVVHAVLGHVDWAIALALTVGVVPGARLGAALTIRAGDRALRLVVGVFLGILGLAYGVFEVAALAGG